MVTNNDGLPNPTSTLGRVARKVVADLVEMGGAGTFYGFDGEYVRKLADLGWISISGFTPIKTGTVQAHIAEIKLTDWANERIGTWRLPNEGEGWLEALKK